MLTYNASLITLGSYQVFQLIVNKMGKYIISRFGGYKKTIYLISKKCINAPILNQSRTSDNSTKIESNK